MLVLSRKLDESIIIDNDIVITIVKIDGNKVRLGIAAPNHKPVPRQEIWDQLHAVKKLPPPPEVIQP